MALVARLREYAGEVLNARNDAEPPYSNDYECALAAADAADYIEQSEYLCVLTVYRKDSSSPLRKYAFRKPDDMEAFRKKHRIAERDCDMDRLEVQ